MCKVKDKNHGYFSLFPSHSLNFRQAILLIKALAECRSGKSDAETQFAVIVAVCNEMLSIDTFNEAVAQTRAPVSVSIHSNFPACLDMECPHKKTCANHKTAGDYRSEDGARPDLVKTESGWQCSRGWWRDRVGAVLVNGKFMGDRNGSMG